MSLSDQLLSRAHSHCELSSNKNYPDCSGCGFFKESMKLLILLILSLSSAFAQEEVIDKDILSKCKTEIENFCAQEIAAKKPRDVVKCLSVNESKLPLECRQQMQRFLQASSQASSRGGGALASFGGMTGLTPPIPLLAYEGRLIPDSGNGEKSNLIRDNRLLISSPVFFKEKHNVIASVSVAHLYMGEQIKLDNDEKVPKNLYRTEVGLMYNRKVGERRNFGLRGSFGYTGDEIRTNTQSFSLAATYTYPRGSGQWLLMAFLSNNAGTFVPIPGFGYIIRTPTFNASLGLPMISMQWTPVAPWSFSFSALGPQLSSEAAYGSVEKIQYFTGLNWTQQRYLLAERDEYRDRLTFEEKKWGNGIRTPLSKTSLLETQAGLIFDRKIYNGQGMFDHSGGDAKLEADGFVSLSYKIAL